MKHLIIAFHLILIAFYGQAQTRDTEELAVQKVLNEWHEAAANASFKNYFNALTEKAVFIGTDASENWTKKDFETYAKPHFDKGKAWNFKSLERHIYFSADKKTAWFDELLDTQMKICRGSGVLIKVKKEWKIAHYVLSIAVPNEFTEEVVKVKAESDEQFIEKIKG